MPTRSATVDIVPKVLAWARTSSGLSRGALSSLMKVESDVIAEWERDSSRTELTVVQIEALAKHFRRPVISLLLNQPPPDATMPTDFRRSDYRSRSYSPELRLAARRARRLQKLASGLLQTVNPTRVAELPQFSQGTAAPDEAASQLRDLLAFPKDIHSRWRDSFGAFRGWRSVIEELDILVFSSNFLREEAQGFSISDTQPWVIVVSAKDSPSARSFTLWHELGHLLLRNGGICSGNDSSDEPVEPLQSVEDWCNRFAESVLVDRDLLAQRPETDAVINRIPGYENALRRLAGHFRVSQQVALYRMRHMGLLTTANFRHEFNRVMSEQNLSKSAKRDNRSEQMRRNIPREVVAERGPTFTRAILQAFDQGGLTRSDVSDYLGVRSKHLESIRREAHR